MPSRELKDLVAAWQGVSQKEQAVLATVIRTEGSTYRKVGARMLFTDHGSLAGSVSGGCLEADLLGLAGSVIHDGPKTVVYDSTAESDIVWGFGLGCNGVVTILLQPHPLAAQVMEVLAGVLESKAPAILETCVKEGPGLGQFRRLPEFDTSEPREGWLRERIEPPKRIVMFGAGFDAPPLIRIAQEIGWDVTVVDHRRELLGKLQMTETVQSQPGHAPVELIDSADAIVVMTHNYLNDLQILRQLSARPPGYVGLLGPGARGLRLQRELAEAGCPPIQVASPVGLDIGSSGPHEIALAVVAEIQAHLAGRSGGRLGSSGAMGPRDEERVDAAGNPSAFDLVNQ